MLDFPFSPERLQLTYRKPRELLRSPFTGKGQRQQGLNEWWIGSITMPAMDEERAAQWRAFIVRLRGQAGVFRLGDPKYERRGAGGAGQVEGANQLGRTLLTSGWFPGTEGVLLAGDQFELDDRLYVVTQDADANDSGVAELHIWPRLRESPVDGTSLQLDAPRGRWRLASVQAAWDIRPGQITNATISIAEAL